MLKIMTHIHLWKADFDLKEDDERVRNQIPTPPLIKLSEQSDIIRFYSALQ